MAETIREFLVSLGYRVDGNSEAKFKGAIESATRGAIALGTAVTAASVAVTAAVTKIAAGFDDLYYASARTKASAENIKAVGFAVSQLGGSYQGAVSSIEAFALRMRSNPGYEAMAKNLGVVTRQNGQLRDTTVIMTDLAKVLDKKPTYVALQYLEALGIDEATYNALKSGELVRYTEEYRAKQAALGVTQSRAADVGKELTQAWRSLSATAAALGDKLLVSLGPGIKDFVDRVDAFLVRNADKIVQFFERAGVWVGKLVTAFAELVEKGEGPIVEFCDKVVKGVDKMQVAFAALATFLGGAFLISVLGAFTKVGAGFAGMLLKLGINPVTIGLGIGMAPSTANAGEDQEIARRRAAGTWGDQSVAPPPDNRNWWQRTMPKALGGRDAPAGVDPSGGRSTGARGVAAAQEAYAFWRSKGLTHEQATGVVANEQAESNHNPNARGDGGAAHGLYQHHPDRRANILAGTGIDMSTATAQQQREGAHWEMTQGKEQAAWRALQEAKSAGEAAAVISQKYERPRDSAGEASKRAAIANGLAGVLSLKPVVATPSVAEPEAGDLAAEYKRRSGRDLASDMKNYPDHAPQWIEQYTGRKAPTAAPSFDASRFNAVSPARVQANAALIGGFGLSGPVALTPPPANSNTSVDMNQKTEITILGGSDPQATASAVAGAQDKVNGGLLRNMAGAVR